jgi:hypothetical protein
MIKHLGAALLLLFIAVASLNAQVSLGKIKYQNLGLWDSIPVFPGGDTALTAYINNNFTLPDTAKTCGIGGTIFIKFYVESNGHIVEFANFNSKLNKDKKRDKAYNECADYTFDLVVRHLKDIIIKMPRWAAATNQFGVPIRCLVTLPVIF